MTDRFGRISLALLLLALATACSSSPAQPSGTTTGGTASITAPRPAQPADGTQVQYSGQPVTLVVQNAVVTQGSTKTYTFEVATDTAFGSKVQTRDVSEGTN